MLAKGSNDFLTPIGKDCCRSISCVGECLSCISAKKHYVLSCSRSLTRPRIALDSCAWQKPFPIPSSLAQRRRQRLVSSNARESCNSWLKKFWSVKIPSLFVTASRFLRVRLKTAARSQKAQITFCVRGVASPLLANVYLHYVFDLWVQAWRQKRAHGDVVVVRFADDIVVGFNSQADAEQFRAELTERMKEFHLELHPEKTRLLEFGPYAIDQGR